mgnify:CR=1 FL=1
MITPEMAELVYDLSNGHTYYVQMLCRELWSTYTKEINTSAQVLSTLTGIVERNSTEYFSLRNLLTAVQWSVLTAVAADGVVAHPTSHDFLTRYGLGTSATVLRSLEALVDRELIYRNEQGHYAIYNPFFGWWVANILRR